MNRRATSLVVSLALASSVASACTPTRSRMQPYRDDANAAAGLARRAGAVCACLRGADDLPPHSFTTDGCSMSPDGNWGGCCVEHDIAYWCGGSAADRREADRRLAGCVVAARHSPFMAGFVRAMVWAGGMPWGPFPWRWGYGWDGIRGYETRKTGRSSVACFGTPERGGGAAAQNPEGAPASASEGVGGSPR